MPTPPLTGVRVLDLSRLLPGPYCTMLLADLGAEVIKVEAPGLGDYARTVVADFGGPALFDVVNRGKRGVALNYRDPAGRALLLRLAATCDVFVETFRPGAAARWGIDYAAVREANPAIIYCSLSGYGQEGPYAGRAGHDLNYIAVGGLLSINGEAGGPPIPPGVQIADLSGGMLAALAITAALAGQRRTGEGTYLDVSMLDAVVSWMAPMAGSLETGWRLGHETTRGRTPLGGTLPCYNVYGTADGKYLTLSALEPHFWVNFCKTAGREDLIDRRLDPEAIPEVAAFFRSRALAEWLAYFGGTDACLEPVNDLDEMVEHPQVRYRGLVDAAGRITAPFCFVPGLCTPAPAPRMGEHTREILGALGIDEARLDELAQAGVIA